MSALHRREVRVDPTERLGGLVDLEGEARLQIVQRGDLGLLLVNVLLELRLACLGIAQLVAAGRRCVRRCAEEADGQQDQQRDRSGGAAGSRGHRASRLRGRGDRRYE